MKLMKAIHVVRSYNRSCLGLSLTARQVNKIQFANPNVVFTIRSMLHEVKRGREGRDGGSGGEEGGRWRGEGGSGGGRVVVGGEAGGGGGGWFLLGGGGAVGEGGGW